MSLKRTCLLLWLFLIILVSFHDGYNIAYITSAPVLGTTVSNKVETDFIGKMIWILIVLLPFIKHWLVKMIYAILIAIFAIHEPLIQIENVVTMKTEFVQVLLLTLILSAGLYKYVCIYQHNNFTLRSWDGFL